MYNRVSSLPAVASHGTVNHLIVFINSTTGGSYPKYRIILEPGKNKVEENERLPHPTELTSYLDEFMWRERHGQSTRLVFNSIIRDISNQYPLPLLPFSDIYLISN